ncbi:MAG: UDP-N-acetylmuramoyl-tripeptide--D-alanyl-D-alanine ligase [Elusimicrobia bacterium]|nr:UDP-N-acetylmuramoyl-tripeptide--D-alanyl-D-alanine ligase [Elusimicrobiota bacterium]
MVNLSIKQIAELVRGVPIQGPLVGKIRGVSVDSRKTKKGNLFIALKGENSDGHKFLNSAFLAGAAASVVGRRIKQKTKKPVILVRNSLAALQEIAAFWRTKISPKVIAVTGSNGKTTTKDIIAHIAKKNFRVVSAKKSFNNFIGVPLTVCEANPKTEILVLEMETNKIGGIGKLCGIAQPDIGIITNIGETHLQFLKNKYNVFKEKSELVTGIGESGTVILNADTPYTEKLRKMARGKTVTYSIRKPADFTAREISTDINGATFAVNGKIFRMKIPGIFNVSNALAAIAAARIIGIGWGTIRARLKTFSPQKGRINVKKIRGKILIDDSYNANPDSAAALCEILRNLAGKKILVFGDMLELGNRSEELHRKTGKRFAAAGVSEIFYRGQFASSFIKGALSAGKGVRAKIIKSPQKAAEEITRAKAAFIIFKGSRKMEIDKIFDYVSHNLSFRSR